MKNDTPLQNVEQFTEDLQLMLEFASNNLFANISINDMTVPEQYLVDCYSRINVWIEVLLKLKDDRIYCDVVMSGARSIFELYLDIHILKDNNDSDVKKMDAFVKTCLFRARQKEIEIATEEQIPFDDLLKEYQQVNANQKHKMEAIAFEHWCRSKNGKPKWPNHWSGEDTRKRAKRLGKVFLKLYARIYSATSWCIHGNPLPVSEGNDFNRFCAFGYGFITKMFFESSRLCIEHITGSAKDLLLTKFDSECGHIKTHLTGF